MQDSRNTLIFVVCAMVLLIAYQMLVLGPAAKRREAETKASETAAAVSPTAPAAAPVEVNVPREQALAASPRIPIDTPALKGSIALTGARIDDLYLKRYRQTIDRNSPQVELLRPQGAANAYFADIGWTGANIEGLPGEDTAWTLSKGSVLRPGEPVVRTYRSPQCLTFTRAIALVSH